MPGWRIVLWAVLVLASVFFLYLVRGVLLPFLLSFVLAVMLEPGVRRLRKIGMSKGGAVATVMLMFLGVVIGLGLLVAPSIARETQMMTSRVEDLTGLLAKESENDNFFLRWNPVLQAQESRPTSQVDQLFLRYGGMLDRLGLPSSRHELMEQYVDKSRPQIARAVRTFSDSAFGILTNIFSEVLVLVIVPILLPLILMEADGWKMKIPRWIPPSIRASTVAMFSDIGQVFAKYLRGILTVLLLYTGVVTFYLWIMGVPSWVVLGPLFGALYLVPYVGNIISSATVFGVVGLNATTGWLFHPFANPWAYALMVMLIYLLIAFSFDHMIYPQMVGNSVGLSPVISMFVIFCGGALFGLVGMLIAFPLAGACKVILDRLIRVTSSSQEALRLPSVPLRHRET